jgi:hypothetical protein
VGQDGGQPRQPIVGAPLGAQLSGDHRPAPGGIDQRPCPDDAGAVRAAHAQAQARRPALDVQDGGGPLDRHPGALGRLCQHPIQLHPLHVPARPVDVQDGRALDHPVAAPGAGHGQAGRQSKAAEARRDPQLVERVDHLARQRLARPPAIVGAALEDQHPGPGAPDDEGRRQPGGTAAHHRHVQGRGRRAGRWAEARDHERCHHTGDEVAPLRSRFFRSSLVLAALSLSAACPPVRPTPPRLPDGVLLGPGLGAPSDDLAPWACWRAGSFAGGAACQGIVPVGTVFPQLDSRVEVVRPEEAPCGDGHRATLAVRWLMAEPYRRSVHDPVAWPPEVQRTLVRPTFARQDEEALRRSRVQAAGLATALVGPAERWPTGNEQTIDVDGDGRPERFVWLQGTGGKDGDCLVADDAFLVFWGSSPERPRLVARHRNLGYSVEAAVDLDGDGRRELLISAWDRVGCPADHSFQALLRASATELTVLGVWDMCGRPLPGGLPSDAAASR